MAGEFDQAQTPATQTLEQTQNRFSSAIEGAFDFIQGRAAGLRHVGEGALALAGVITAVAAFAPGSGETNTQAAERASSSGTAGKVFSFDSKDAQRQMSSIQAECHDRHLTVDPPRGSIGGVLRARSKKLGTLRVIPGEHNVVSLKRKKGVHYCGAIAITANNKVRFPKFNKNNRWTDPSPNTSPNAVQAFAAYLYK